MKTLEIRNTFETAIKKGKLSEEMKPSDYANAISGYIQDASKGLRNAVFVAHFAIERGKDKEVKELLSKSYAPQTIHDMFSCGKNILPVLKEMGMTSYRDPYNLRVVSKPLLDVSHPAHMAIVKGIRENKPVSALRVIRKRCEETKPEAPRIVEVPVLTLTEDGARNAVREACKALAGYVGGGRASMFLASLATEINGIKPQHSQLQ